MNWTDAKTMASVIRHKVFIQEQNVPADLEWDRMDDTAVHAIALIEDKTPIGCARLLPGGQIGRMAVLSRYRNKGVGTGLLAAMETEATRLGMQSVFLHAQTSALPFYACQGYHEEGEQFDEADIPHILMRKQLIADD
jgi:predicted GNAT family N-acyltransferase